MINKKTLKFFKTFNKNRFIKPRYDGYSFANIAPTIFYLLTGKKIGNVLPPDCFLKGYPKPKKIVLFFIDSFGFDLWQKYYKQFPILRRITNEGVVSPISALFPSTTAASVSTMHLGRLPSQHSLFEWYLYIKEYDEVIQTLQFSPLGIKTGDKCLDLGYDPKYLLKTQETIYSKLKKSNIKCCFFLLKDYADSSYISLVNKEVSSFSYHTLAEALINLKKILESKSERSYTYFYWDKIDKICHEYGPNSKQAEAEIANFWIMFDYVFSSYKKPKDTLFVFIADHGQITVDPKTTYYLNLEFPEITQFLKRDKKGNVIYPTGSPRDVFLHIKDNKVDQLLQILSQRLSRIAKVMSINDALKQDFFGKPPYNKRFLERLGQILILPYNRYVWWYEKDKLEVKYHGYHGGLTPEEMITIFGVW